MFNFTLTAALALVLLLAIPASAANVTFEWDCLEGCDVPDLAGFRLYERTPEGTFVKGENYVEVAGPEARSLIRAVIDRHHYEWALTAIDLTGNESDFSDPVDMYVGSRPGKSTISIHLKFKLNQNLCMK